MNVLVLNCGSSSVKYKVLRATRTRLSPLVEGIVERVLAPGMTHRLRKNGGPPQQLPLRGQTLEETIAEVVGAAAAATTGPIEAVGHRVVHAGEKFTGSVLITPEVVAALEECVELAPLHNPANLAGIRVAQQVLKEATHVAVFDNALHHTLPEAVYTYALPWEYRAKYQVRRYGFHGIAFRSAFARAEKIVGHSLSRRRVITLMLGSGCTANARLQGRSVEVSTGFTPLEGLVQSTRSGDVDPAAVLYLMEREGLTAAQMSEVLNKRSGLLGLCGLSDVRDIEAAAARGEARADLALRVFVHRARKYLGAYAAAMGGVDVVIFAGGIGEKSARLRAEICRKMDYMGLELSPARNARATGREALISKPSSRVAVVVVQVDEEAVIARDTFEIVSRGLSTLPFS